VRKQIVIVGLGLIGASFAMALKGFRDYEIVGVDTGEETLSFAGTHGVADRVTPDSGVVEEADVVVLCLHPEGIIRFLKEHASRFRAGALVADVCGVKGSILKAAESLPAGVDFIGCHPMAGKETGGIRNADGALFSGAHMILTPRAGNTKEHLALMKEMGEHMGFRDVVETTPEEHDALIAYTSQLMHILAVAVCDDPLLFSCRGFEGGSFRDCTRVAALDVPLWTELFSLNAPALAGVIRNLEENLKAYRETLESESKSALAEKLAISSARKRRIVLE
jgi:prephenate dehydrogenase